MKNVIRAGFLSLTILFLLLDAGTAADDEWVHLFTRDGIAVYSKTFPGTPVCAFKGVGHVEAGIAVIGSVLQDISAYPQWMARCKESVLLKNVGPDTRVFYSVVDTPLPFKDRDMILTNTIRYHPEMEKAEITFDLYNQGIIPPKKRYFRVTELSGKYVLENLDRHKTRVTFVYKGDPGGNIPVGIANWLESRHYPHTIIMGLRSMVTKEKYLSSAPRDKNRNRN